MERKKMLETHYRASRLCRVLGNPTAYQLLHMLRRKGQTPTELSDTIGLSLKTVSETLRNLRQINLVRYDTDGNNKVYFLKDNVLPHVLSHIEKYVKKMRIIKW
jgi:DNA-binding transcriptional ArsR family regulator